MKVTWEEKGIQSGRKIGKYGETDQEPNYLVISLDDGWAVGVPRSKEELAQALTGGEYIPSELITYPPQS